MGENVIGNSDVYAAQRQLNQKTGAVIREMNNIAETAANATGEDLQKLQLRLAALQRDLDILKQMEEKLAKAAEALSKFVQAQ